MKWLIKVKTLYKKIFRLNDAELTRKEKDFLPEALAIEETPATPKAYLLLWIVIGFVLIAVAWSIFGHVEEVAVAAGKVVPAGYTKSVQAEDKGTVKNILVKDGDMVQAGDTLIELDTTLTMADLAQYKKEQAYYELELERLAAEQEEKEFVYTKKNPAVRQEDIIAQTKLYHGRLTEYRTKLRSTEESIRQTRAAVDKERATEDKLALQLAIISEQEAKMKGLVAQGAVSTFQYQQYLLQKLGYKQDLVASDMEITRLQHLLTQYEEEKAKIDDERQNEVMTKIVEDRRQLALTEENLKKAEEKNRQSIIKAPMAGRVQKLSVHTRGAIVTTAQELLIIVPENTAMKIEAWVENKDIGFIYEGQPAALKVETFNFQKYGTLPAVVETVSTDAVENKEGKLLYKTILRPEETEFHLITGRTVPLVAGMSVSAEIKTKDKRIIEYFLDPFLQYKSEGLRER